MSTSHPLRFPKPCLFKPPKVPSCWSLPLAMHPQFQWHPSLQHQSIATLAWEDLEKWHSSHPPVASCPASEITLCQLRCVKNHFMFEWLVFVCWEKTFNQALESLKCILYLRNSGERTNRIEPACSGGSRELVGTSQLFKLWVKRFTLHSHVPKKTRKSKANLRIFHSSYMSVSKNRGVSPKMDG